MFSEIQDKELGNRAPLIYNLIYKGLMFPTAFGQIKVSAD